VADPGQLFGRLAATLRRQREQVSQVVAEAQEALADFAANEPPLRELRGIGAILHDFYTGLEHMFEAIAPELNGGLPAGPSWHRNLLENMTLDIPSVRPPLLRRETARVLEEFLRFRHLFRNQYGFELEWSRLQSLLKALPAAWNAVEADLDSFLAFLDSVAVGGLG